MCNRTGGRGLRRGMRADGGKGLGGRLAQWPYACLTDTLPPRRKPVTTGGNGVSMQQNGGK